jgi:hypothetical protein
MPPARSMAGVWNRIARGSELKQALFAELVVMDRSEPGPFRCRLDFTNKCRDSGL